MSGQPPIYCVSLDGSLGRRARMRRRLAHHGLLARTQYVDAIEPPPVRDWSTSWKDRAGAAAFASHLKAMRMLLADGRADGGAIVCEDDILLHDEFSEHLTAVLDNLPSDAPFCSLGYMRDRWEPALTWAGGNPDRRNLCRLEPGAVWGLHCYWIASGYARVVLGRYGALELDELPTITERIAFESGGYLSHPPLALQDAIDSNIRPPADLDFHVRSQAAWPYSDYSDCEQGDDRSPLAFGPSPQRSIALCMIVRDEAAVIGRCLDSVRPLIDTWVICDTGSRDGTPQLIERLLEGVPGRLHQRPWQDFGWNRSELMDLARGSADYLLLLDADMTLDWRGPLPPLGADAYLLRHAGDLDYAVLRLVRGDRRWWFEGSTHEYLATEGPYTQEALGVLVVEHHADGGSRAEKLQRDARLLERDLRWDPDNARATFYLAQTYRDLGEEERAVELYRRRAELGGWEEEVFYALYQAGCLLGSRDASAGMPLLLSAWQRRPSRAEPLHELARICRFAGWHEAARMFAARGLEIPYPEDRLFVYRWIYEWGLQYEFALAAFETGEREAAVAAVEDLLGMPQLPADVEAFLRGRHTNLGRRVRRASTLSMLAPGAELAEIRLDVSPAWPQFNPTIAQDGDGFRLIVRTANYRLENGRYVFLTDEPVIQTQNYLLTLDRELRVSGVAPLVDRGSGVPRHFSRVEGYEDCRLVRLNGDWLATATVRDRNPEERCEVALLRLDGSEISAVSVLRGPEPGRHEKNWMPFVRDSALYFLYSCDPTVVLRCDPPTSTIETVSRLPGPAGADGFRGGSQGMAVDDGFLFVVHETVSGSGARSYAHRLVLLDGDQRVVGISPQFSFVSDGVEFCAGLARRDRDLLLTFGVGDCAAGLAVLPIGEALSLLEPVRVC